MKITVSGGAGAMGTMAVRDLAESPAVRPKPFLNELAKRGIKINETIETTHTL